MRRFNTTGPVDSDRHYSIPPLSRPDLPRILDSVGAAEYFVLHAPRQTGKTSVLMALREHLNTLDYRCVYASLEAAKAADGDPDIAIPAALAAIAAGARRSISDDSLERIYREVLDREGAATGFQESLSRWAEETGGERLVLLLDETDSLTGTALLSLLVQIRGGFPDHPRKFPRSVVFCGVRDVQDYPLPSDSPFNIVNESLRLGDFSRAEVEELLDQHTRETGQPFAPDAVEEVWTSTNGQPWLVNALAFDACFRDERNRDRTHRVEAAAIAAARERLILKRPTHLRQIGNKLREERVRRVVEPILAGRKEMVDFHQDDLLYVRDLGLTGPDGGLDIANPIYREVIPRLLAAPAESQFRHDSAPYRRSDGALDAEKLLSSFQDFFRENAEWWARGFQYWEAAVQVLLQAFLHRVVNAGGRITREYALGMGRTDLLVEWKTPNRWQRFVVECKVRRKRDSLAAVVREGAEQTAAYLDRCRAAEGYLVIFDSEEGKTREEKIFRREVRVRRRSVEGAGDERSTRWEVADEPAAASSTPARRDRRTIRIWGM